LEHNNNVKIGQKIEDEYNKTLKDGTTTRLSGSKAIAAISSSMMMLSSVLNTVDSIT